MSKLVLYTKDECPACTNTKTFLTKNSIDFEEYGIIYRSSRDEVIQKFPNAKTVPIIVIDDSITIGGYTDLLRLYENKELFVLLDL